MTYGAHYNWLVLIAMSLAGVCIRAWFVARHRQAQWRPLALTAAAVAALAIAAVVAALCRRRAPSAGVRCRRQRAEEPRACRRIVHQRCVPCHASRPTRPASPPRPTA